jgi:ubiquinone/menaquinone biosynthesis C-methylase UbiE
MGIANHLLSDVLSLIMECATLFDQPLRVLEVGAGTGSCTSAVLPLLRDSGTSFIYTYTDLSPSFFANAETEFGKLDYQILDIEKDPLSQGFSPAQFDLVIAANVLHATQDITVSISNCRILTRNGGKILMLESFIPNRTIDSIFGLLDGYWRFTDRELRPWHTLVDYPVWEKVMISSGFEKATSLPICEGLMGVVMATASETVPPLLYPSQQKPIWLLLGPENQLVTKLRNAIEQSNRMVATDADQVSDLKSLEGVLYLWGTSQDSSQEVITKGFLELTQQIYSNDMTKLVVVTMGSGGVDIDDEPVIPTGGSLYGITRTLRNETKLPIKSIDLESDEDIDIQV